jgi:heptosyltransferase II
MAEFKCRHFNGYKPCGHPYSCNSDCPKRDVPSERILIVHLEALGAVLRSTTLLSSIKRKYPNSHITWITKKPANALLVNLPQIDRVLTTSSEDVLALSALDFDIAFCIDKSLTAAGVLSHSQVKKIYGFVADRATGAIKPATKAAEELYEIGLSDQKKFFENKKTETELVCEALELPFERDPYLVQLSQNERELAHQRRMEWAPAGEITVGINTGCAPNIPYKKLSVQMQREIVKKLSSRPGVRVVLLGGPEDTKRNLAIAEGLNVTSSPTENGLRDGLCSVEACDIVVTGDSLGMHMGIGLKKWVVVWFGPTCAHEIDLYDRGVKVLSAATCTPCWKRSCNKSPMCYDLVDIKAIMAGIEKCNLFSKPLSSGTYSSGVRS